MPLNFPLNPTNGQEYTLNGVTYTFNNEKWTVNSSESPIVNSAQGDLIVDGSLTANTRTNTISAITSGTIDCSTANFFDVSLSSNTTFSFTNVPTDDSFSFKMKLSASSTVNLTWPNSVTWDAATTALSSLAAGVEVLYEFNTYDGGTTWYGKEIVSIITIGEAVYTTPGTYSWACPNEVTSVSVVCIGGGGGGAVSTDTYASSGGGLGYKNNISVTPGQVYTLQVGARGNHSGIASDSWFIDSSTVKGGAGANNSANGGGDFVGDGGGTGGAGGSKSGSFFGGGGGAGGYSGNGGDGGSGNAGWSNNISPTSTEAGKAGTGGAAGGGHAGGGNGGSAQRGQPGGGTGIFGEGTSGAASVVYGVYYNGSQFTGSGSYGAGAMQDNFSSGGYAGVSGAVRIVWGANRSFPSTNVDQASSNGNISTV